MKKGMFLFIFLIAACDMKPSNSEINDANRLIKEIDKYIAINSVAPKKEDVWKIKERLELMSDPQDDSCPCYERESTNSYIVFFGISLGDSYAYDSKSKVWE